MKKHFVTYDQAVALKELGFKEFCFGFYDDISKIFYQIHSHASSNNDVKNITIAPLKQQAIIFLLNKCDDLHGAELSIEYFGDESGVLKNYGGNFTSLTQAIDKLIMLANDKMP